MPTVPDFGFCGPTYLASGYSFDCQRAINLYPEPGYKTSKGQMMLVGRPGLNLFGTAAYTPIRALWAGVSTSTSGRLFAAAGTHFLEINNAGATSTDYGVMAGSTGAGQCQVEANVTQLLVCDRNAGKVYNADPTGPVMTAVFNGVALAYLDGFYVAVATGASLVAANNPNQVNVSANGDGTTWNALAYAYRTGAADLVTQVASLNGLLWVLGQKTIEVWYNAGTAIFPFARVGGGTINLGVLSPQSVVKFNNTIMWLGASDTGWAQVYMTQGMNPVRVSNHAIEQYLTSFSVGLMTTARAYGYQEAGHTFYVLNFMSGEAPTGITLVYDLTTGLWHERVYYYDYSSGPYPVCFACQPGFIAGPNFVGDGLTGKICQQSIGYFSDTGSVKIKYIRRVPHISNSNRVLKHERFELEGELGSANPVLAWANDGGVANLGAHNMQQATDFGITGTRRRFFVNQMGRARDRVYQVTIESSADSIRLAAAYLNVDAGDET